MTESYMGVPTVPTVPTCMQVYTHVCARACIEKFAKRLGTVGTVGTFPLIHINSRFYVVPTISRVVPTFRNTDEGANGAHLRHLSQLEHATRVAFGPMMPQGSYPQSSKAGAPGEREVRRACKGPGRRVPGETAPTVEVGGSELAREDDAMRPALQYRPTGLVRRAKSYGAKGWRLGANASRVAHFEPSPHDTRFAFADPEVLG
jgi:hypothetical protein